MDHKEAMEAIMAVRERYAANCPPYGTPYDIFDRHEQGQLREALTGFGAGGVGMWHPIPWSWSSRPEMVARHWWQFPIEKEEVFLLDRSKRLVTKIDDPTAQRGAIRSVAKMIAMLTVATPVLLDAFELALGLASDYARSHDADLGSTCPCPLCLRTRAMMPKDG